jgi:hypothetical protein
VTLLKIAFSKGRTTLRTIYPTKKPHIKCSRIFWRNSKVPTEYSRLLWSARSGNSSTALSARTACRNATSAAASPPAISASPVTSFPTEDAAPLASGLQPQEPALPVESCPRTASRAPRRPPTAASAEPDSQPPMASAVLTVNSSILGPQLARPVPLPAPPAPLQPPFAPLVMPATLSYSQTQENAAPTDSTGGLEHPPVQPAMLHVLNASAMVCTNAGHVLLGRTHTNTELGAAPTERPTTVLSAVSIALLLAPSATGPPTRTATPAQTQATSFHTAIRIRQQLDTACQSDHSGQERRLGFVISAASNVNSPQASVLSVSQDRSLSVASAPLATPAARPAPW